MSSPNPCELFKLRLQDQGGRVHYAESLEEGLELAVKLVVERGVRLVGLGSMPPYIMKGLMERLRAKGVAFIARGEGGAIEGLARAEAGITLARLGVADIGSIVEVSEDDWDRLVSSLPKLHLCLLNSKDVLPRLEEAAPLLLEHLQLNGPKAITLIAGPSRTGDIELRLVLGVHGPHEVHVVLWEGERGESSDSG